MKKWKILNDSKVRDSNEVINILLENRSIKTKKEVEDFLVPKLEKITTESVGISKQSLEKTLKKIKKSIKEKEQIVVYGDYDVDGITGTAILWEALFEVGAKVMPYIPHRVDEGYGLSKKGIENIKLQIPDTKLIITVDNGIVANEAVDFANENGIDVIITDHHTKTDKPPKAFSIFHTTKLCGAGVGYLLAQKFSKYPEKFLDLVTLATVADLVPLTGPNRTFVKLGLKFLQNTKRVGLLELFKEAGIEREKIGVYEIGHVIGPRLNAMGRLESAMDSLRLLCTTSKKRAVQLAQTLGATNRGRQLLTQSSAMHAVEKIKNVHEKLKIIFITEDYEEGIIGLVAGKLVDAYYRPAIVVSRGEKISKASARSVAGFNIIEFIRKASDLLVNAGGHPMAAGFTVETKNIDKLKQFLEKHAEDVVTDEHLVRELKVDCELPIGFVNQNFYDELQRLSPFGMGNPEPTFTGRGVVINNIRTIGRDKKHLKMIFDNGLEAVAFNLAEKANGLIPGDKIDIVYSIEENEWNGRKKLQIKVRDFNQD